MHGIIYQYTNTLSGLVYVGQTIHPARRQREYMTEVASNRPNARLIIQAMQQAGRGRAIKKIPPVILERVL